MRVVIIAGGKGTRIASVNSEIPKAMIPVCVLNCIQVKSLSVARLKVIDFRGISPGSERIGRTGNFSLSSYSSSIWASLLLIR